MKIININSAYPADGKSMIIRLIGEDVSRLGKRVLIIDNSPTLSGFIKMYNLFELPRVDTIRPLIKGQILSVDQLNEIIVTLDSDLDLDYLSNSEIYPLEDEEILYLTKLLEKEYDYIFIESNQLISSNKFSIENILITRPCEYILKDKKNYQDYNTLIINKYNKSFNINAKKLEALLLEYSSDIVMLENGYNVQLSSETKSQIRSITNKIIGFQISDILFEEDAKSSKFKFPSLFRKKERSME